MRLLRAFLSWRSAGYLAYGLTLLALLLYARFPADKFKQFCENRLGSLLTDSTCAIDRIEYQLPLTLNFFGVHLRKITESGASELTLDRLSLALESAGKHLAFTLSGALYGGQVSAHLAIGGFARGRIAMNDIRLVGLDAAALQKDLGRVDRKISGTFSFTGEYQADTTGFTAGIGGGRIEMAAGSVALLQPVLSLNQIDFHHLSANIRYEKSKLTIRDGVLKGTDLAGDFSGTVALNDSYSQSELQLGGRLVPQAAFLMAHPQEEKMVQAVMKRYNMTALPFGVGGTLTSPIFRLSN